MIKTFSIPQGNFELERYPKSNNNSLQAFDAADEYILNYIDETTSDNNLSILIFNDNYGALTCALNQHNITIVTDSVLSQIAVKENLKRNNLDTSKIIVLNSLDNLEKSYDFVIVKIPKTLSFLEYILQQITNLEDAIPVFGTTMIRLINKSTLDIFDNYLLETKTSLAKKKARIIFSKTGKKEITNVTVFPTKYQTDIFNYSLLNYANVFSGKKLDIGTRFFLENFPKLNDTKTIVDLGCGNGVLAVHAANIFPDAKIICTDESYMAVASTKQSLIQNGFISAENYIFIVGDGLKDFEENSVDLILCNPPFHQENVISTEIANQMFVESQKVLTQNGELWIVANKHLGYHVILEKIFESVEIIVSNAKFVIIKAKN